MESHFSIPQSPQLKELIQSFWQVRKSNTPPQKEIIIPKGVFEIIFSFESPPQFARINNRELKIPRCFIQGFYTSPIELQLSDEQVFFGVILNPGIARHCFHFLASEFANNVTDLTLVDKAYYRLWNQLGELALFSDRVNLFSQWILNKGIGLTEREKAFHLFLNTHDWNHLSVPDTARQFCYSARQLSRKLQELTGMNTEQILLYKKYLQSVELIHFSGLSLTKIAYACHFTDQSHFIKTFKGLSLLTPGEYRHKKSMLFGHILENVL